MKWLLLLSLSTFAASAAAATELRRLDVAGAELHFFPMVADALEALSAAGPSESPAPAAITCPANAALDDERPACAGANLSATRGLCREVYSPLEALAARPPSAYSLLRARDLNYVIETFAPALARMENAGGFAKRSYFDRLAPIVVKMRLPQLRQKLAQRRDALSACDEPVAEAELDQVEATLNDLEREGLKRAARDASARARTPLPYPSLTDDERRFLSATLGGFLWRARGGGLFLEPTNTNLRRIAFTLLPMRELARLNGGDEAAGLGTALWLGLFKPWGHFHDMGRLDGDKWTDLAKMRERGVFQVSKVVSELRALGLDPTTVEQSGPMMGDCYWFGWERLEHRQVGMNLTAPYSAAFGVATNWGEFCTGASIALGMSEALLAGRAP